MGKVTLKKPRVTEYPKIADRKEAKRLRLEAERRVRADMRRQLNKQARSAALERTSQ